MNPLFPFVLATLFVALHGVSLIAKNETIRGLGRIILGFSLFSYGVAGVEIAPAFSIPGLAAFSSWVLLVVGLVTVGSGVHKYRRRNVAQ
ncbi:MAG TPA: hypothetical protein V6C81_26900 [Planktothrix sp.]|jgi:hypothetical protein